MSQYVTAETTDKEIATEYANVHVAIRNCLDQERLCQCKDAQMVRIAKNNC